MKLTLNAIKKMAEDKFGALETGEFYDIADLNIKIETKTGFQLIKKFIVKSGTNALFTFENGAAVSVQTAHFFMTPTGKQFASELKVGDEVNTVDGVTKIAAIAVGQETEFYDIEVDSAEHTFLSADGIEHHNTGKTQNVEDELHAAGKSDGNGYVKITGSASTSGIYRLMFQNRKEIMLFDDSDGALADQDSRNLFKAASDTKKIRKISWQKSGGGYVDADDYDYENPDQDKLPRTFEFTGKIIFISNLPLSKLDPDGALRTRGFVVNIDPTNQEIFDFMAKICGKIGLDVDYKLGMDQRIQVVDWLRQKKIQEKTANLRSLVRGLNIFAGTLAASGSVEEARKFIIRFA